MLRARLPNPGPCGLAKKTWQKNIQQKIHGSTSVVLNLKCFAPSGHLTISLVVTRGGKGPLAARVEVRDAAKYPAMHGTGSHKEELFGPKMSIV